MLNFADEIWDHKIEPKEGFQPKSFKTYNLTPEEKKQTRCLFKGQPWKRLHSTFAISDGYSVLLCEKERWKVMAMPRLLFPEWVDDQERLPPPTNLWNNG